MIKFLLIFTDSYIIVIAFFHRHHNLFLHYIFCITQYTRHNIHNDATIEVVPRCSKVVTDAVGIQVCLRRSQFSGGSPRESPLLFLWQCVVYLETMTKDPEYAPASVAIHWIRPLLTFPSIWPRFVNLVASMTQQVFLRLE